MRAFRLAYDGRPYHGFQRQPDVPTVEGAVFDALRELGVLGPDAEKPDGYAAAGRTDAGVSAVAQTVAFDCPEWCTPRALNAELPEHVRAWAAADAPREFHATHDARHREYVYHLYAPGANDGLADQALDALAGRHDFHNLTPDDDNTARALDYDLLRDGEFLVISLRSDGFCRELVRRVVSLVHAVAAGDAPMAKVDHVLGPDPVDGPEGVAPAPAHPLVLTGVEYDDAVRFETDDDAARSLRAVFGAKRATHAALARVAGDVLDGVY